MGGEEKGRTEEKRKEKEITKIDLALFKHLSQYVGGKSYKTQ